MARVWISAHDGDKVVKGVANRRIKITKFGRKEIEDVVSPRTPGFPERGEGTEVIVLGAGEERTICGGLSWPSSRTDIGVPRSKSCWDMRGGGAGEDGGDETDVEVESVRAESLNKCHAI